VTAHSDNTPPAAATARSPGWYHTQNIGDIESPALLVYPDRIDENIRRMIRLAGDVCRLRPHLKTVKLPEVVKMLMRHGIDRFKCATIAEAEMAAIAGAPDVLLAGQPVGPNVTRLVTLVRRFPQTKFSTLVDDHSAASTLSSCFAVIAQRLEVWLDLDCGMHRTGIAPGPAAIDLYQHLVTLPGLVVAGIHAYDGHIHETDPRMREDQCAAAFAPVVELRQQLAERTIRPVPLIAGGTPTFPFHAKRPDTECGPGTCLLWDFGYADRFPDLDFLQAALVLTRIVSKPQPDLLCLDLGHKAIASENPQPRVRFPELPDAAAVMHSEEHLVIQTGRADRYSVGDPLYGVPRHICPTVALHADAVVIRQNRATERWKITARDRRLGI
jgi:D-serine deaminase-like pyridoxal phosphate-dependent protein